MPKRGWQERKPQDGMCLGLHGIVCAKSSLPRCLALRCPYSPSFQDAPFTFFGSTSGSAISLLSLQPLCCDAFSRPWHRFSHRGFPIQLSVSLPVRANAPLHTGCVLQVLREIIKPLSAYCPFPVSMATMTKCFFSHISGMPFTSFLPTLQFPSGGGDAYPAASPEIDPNSKGSVLPVPPRQMLERMGQCWVAGGHHLGTNSPDRKLVSSEEAMVTPGPHREPVSARLALLAPAGVEGESQLSLRRASLPCRGVL